jgi:hypothetical protein
MLSQCSGGLGRVELESWRVAAQTTWTLTLLPYFGENVWSISDASPEMVFISRSHRINDF